MTVLAVLDRHHQRCAAGEIVTPQFVIVQVGAKPADEDRLAVGAPCGRGEHGIVVAEADLACVAPIRPGDPQVLGTRPVADERDHAAIGCERGLRVEPNAARNARGATAGRRHGIEIAEQVEYDRAAVGGDVERHPCPGRRRKPQLPRRLDRQCLPRGLLRPCVLRLSDRGQQRERRRRNRARPHHGVTGLGA